MSVSKHSLQWSRFIEGLPPEHQLRQLILASWRRSSAAGVNPEPGHLQFRSVSDEELRRRLEENKEMIRIAAPHLEWATAALSQVPHVICLTDRDGIILYTTGNDDQMRKCGLRPGYDWSEQTMGTNGAGTALATGQPVAVIGSEHFNQAFAGYTCLAAPVRDAEGQVVGAVDISTKVKDGQPERLVLASHISYVIERELAYFSATAQAEVLSKAKDRLIAEVSHELRNPLNTILGWTRLLRQGGLEPEQTAKAVEMIERYVKLQSGLIEDLLDVSRIITGNLRLEMQPVDLLSIAQTVVDAAQPGASDKALQLDLEIEEAAAGALLGDAQRLEQVISNLITNAIKFTPAGGRIKVRVGRSDAFAVVTVSDTGRGISPEMLPHIFEHFRQDDGASAARGSGLGLGLAIAQQLVLLHGGTIQAESEGRGRGSTFRVILPLETNAKPAMTAPISAPRAVA